jgi:histidinol dehydrogenase
LAQVDDASAQSIPITDSAGLAADVARGESQLATCPAPTSRGPQNDFGAIIMVGNSTSGGARERDRRRTSGNHEPDPRRCRQKSAMPAIFLGPHTPEAIGDYVGGSTPCCRRRVRRGFRRGLAC